MLAAAKSVQGNALDLETSRVAYEGAKVGGGAAFLALDVETYEWRHELILEVRAKRSASFAGKKLTLADIQQVGWSSVHWTKNGEEVRTDRHASKPAVVPYVPLAMLTPALSSLAVIQENSHKRNGKFSPDARDVSCLFQSRRRHRD